MMTFLAQSGGMGWFAWFWMLLLLFLGCFMILLVLLQRGRGGGLVGALGGAGGQSAFGTRAGDVFTKITIVVATLWVATAGIGSIVLRNASTSASSSLPDDVIDPLGVPGDLGAVGAPLGDTPKLEIDDTPIASDGDDTATDADGSKPDDGETGTGESETAEPEGDTLKAPDLPDPAPAGEEPKSSEPSGDAPTEETTSE